MSDKPPGPPGPADPADENEDLYDELGVAPDATHEVLRASYRRQARQLHPDVAREPSGEAMRRLNQAWAVLGDPQRRRRYDESLAAERDPQVQRPFVARPQPAIAPFDDPIPSWWRRPYLRPSALLLIVLAIIFVVTAYAGPGPGNQTNPSPTPVTGRGASSVAVVGQCVADQTPVSVVSCLGPNDGQVLAEVPTGTPCPSGTRAYPWQQHLTVLCAALNPTPSP